MTASDDSDPHRNNGAYNLKTQIFKGITCVPFGTAGYAFLF